MEYIEQPPKEENKKRKQIKYSIIFSSLAVVLVGLIVGMYFLCANIFIEYDNIGYFQFRYEYGVDQEETGVTITYVEDSENLPEVFRIPNTLNGYKVTGIGDGAFAGIDKIKEVVLPNTITTIGAEAFASCYNLETFNVPTSLESIGQDAFYNTAWLDNQPNNSAVEIGDFLYSFKGQFPYPSAIASSEESYNRLVASGEYEEVYPLYEIDKMSDAVFSGQTGFAYVEFPAKFGTVNSSLFANCTGIETVVLEEGITAIGESAFASCNDLTTINFPSTLTSIGQSAFVSCISLTSIDLTTANLSEIGYSAFSYCTSLASVVIPDGISIISDYVFANCTSLATVEFENDEYDIETSKITEIRNNAFYGCAFTEFKVPFAVITIYNSAFNSCPNLEAVYLYEGNSSSAYGITSINTSAFSNCIKLDSIILVNIEGTNVSNENEVSFPITLRTLGLTTGSGGLIDNTAVTTVNFSQNITHIPSYFANGTETLTTVNIPENNVITSIGSYAFAGTSITTFTVPASVTAIDANTFDGCANLDEVIITYTARVLNLTSINAFNGTGITYNSETGEATGRIVVPDALLESYKSANNWNQLSGCIVGASSI